MESPSPNTWNNTKCFCRFLQMQYFVAQEGYTKLKMSSSTNCFRCNCLSVFEAPQNPKHLDEPVAFQGFSEFWLAMTVCFVFLFTLAQLTFYVILATKRGTEGHHRLQTPCEIQYFAFRHKNKIKTKT